MAEEHEGDTPVASEAAREPAVPVEGRTVTYGTVGGTEVTGYLAAPSNPDSILAARGLNPAEAALPGLVVIHEWWGLNDNVRTAARRLAGEGYRALAVDLYGDSTAQTPGRAQKLMKQAMQDQDQLVANVRAGHEYLRGEGSAPRVGVLGWCFGGSMTYNTLAPRPEAFDAAVAYYGGPEPMTASVLKQLETPLMAHFGTEDEAISIEAARAFEKRAGQTDAPVTYHEYEAGHAFANPSGESYDPAAADTAWTRTTDFLRTHLYGEGGNGAVGE